MRRRTAQLGFMQHKQIRKQLERRLIDAPSAVLHGRSQSALQLVVRLGKPFDPRFAEAGVEEMSAADNDLRYRHEMRKIATPRAKIRKRQVIADH